LQEIIVINIERKIRKDSFCMLNEFKQEVLMTMKIRQMLVGLKRVSVGTIINQ